MPKTKPQNDVTGGVKYLELLADDFKEYMKESREDIKEISTSISDMKSDFNRELGGIQQAITGQNARIKKVEEKTSTLNTEIIQISTKHPNGSYKHLLWRMLPWLIMALLSGAAFTGYAFSGLFVDNEDVVKSVEERLNDKIEKEVGKISSDIDYLIEQQDGGI